MLRPSGKVWWASSFNEVDDRAAGFRTFEVLPEESGERLDRLVARHLNISRSAARRMIEEGLVRVGGVEIVPARKAREGERVEAQLLE